MPQLIFVGIIIVLIAWGLIAMARGDAKLRKQRVSRTIDCKRSGEQVKLVGKVKAVKLVRSPASDRECVGYYVTATFGRRLVTKTLVASFILDDGRGEVVVDCGVGEQGMLRLDLEQDVSESRILRPITVEELPGLAQLGMTKVERLTEAVLMPHDRVAVWGEVQWSSAGTKLVKPERGTFMVSTKDKYFGAS